VVGEILRGGMARRRRWHVLHLLAAGSLAGWTPDRTQRVGAPRVVRTGTRCGCAAVGAVVVQGLTPHVVSRQRASIRPNFTSLNRWRAACWTGLSSLLMGIVLLDRRVVNIREKSRRPGEVKRG
jgi:hypothetical protein